MENLLEVLCVPIIMAIVYAVMAVYKRIVRKQSVVLVRITPLWAALLGTLLGIYGYYRVPCLMLGNNLFVALVVGLACGLAAVGFHQIGVQLGRPADEGKKSDVKCDCKEEPKADAESKESDT